MSAMKRIITLSVSLLAMVVPVLAAADEREPPGDLAVQVFLGFCALIVVVQLVPLARQVVRRLTAQKAGKAVAPEEVPKN